MEPIKLLFVGVGGYGGGYMRELIAHPERTHVRLVGVVDPYVAASGFAETLSAWKVPVYDDVDAFFARQQADLTVISSPITFHAAQSIRAMRAGSHVLVEKPIAATLRDAQAMARVRDEMGKVLAVGFQWCYDEAMLHLKRDVMGGMYGAPLSMRAMVLWPRDLAYYGRGSGWAGKRYDAQGRPVFDNVASNATAHYLENMLWLAGADERGAGLEALVAESARANEIETYDTIALRARLEGGARVFYVASHAVGRHEAQNPIFEYRFEKGVIRFGGLGVNGERLTVETPAGVRDYGVSYPNGNGMVKLWTVVRVIRDGGALPCPAEAAMRHTQAMELVNAGPAPMVLKDAQLDEGMMWVPGLRETLVRCYQEEKLPSELA